MMITERQGKILDKVVQEYIAMALPVSSQLLERRHNFGFCSATIRSEMQELTDSGYLYQPHTSAGRIPTDKGYRFFVDRILEREEKDFEASMEREAISSLEFIREVTRYLASESSSLALGYLEDEKILWKEGWGDVLQEPEFLEPGLALNFAKILDDLEEEVDKFAMKIPRELINVYIGGENPFSEISDFSIITTGLFTILGPKRMRYDRNINLLASVKSSIKNGRRRPKK